MPVRPAGRTRPLLALALGVVTSAALTAPSPALAAETDTPDCDAPAPSTTQPGYTVADPDCDVRGENPFAALPGATAYTGIEDGEAYRIEVPDDWNGDLVVYAHGYRGTGTTVYVDSPTLRQHFIDRGYAWAASSYETNGYDIDQGVADSHELIDRFRAVVPGAQDLDEVIIHGVSMGGHITGVGLERYPETWSAGYPVCGVLGDVELYDYFLDANVTAAASAGVEIGYEEYAGDPAEYGAVVGQQIVPELFTERPTGLTPAGQQWAAAVEQLSGGDRPGFASSLAFWNSFGRAPLADVPFLFGVYPGLNGGRAGGEVATGNIAGNADAVYQLDDEPAVSPAEAALNAAVLRVERDPDATGVPVIEATAEVPVLSLHTTGDLFVPFSMEQIYAAEAEQNGTDFVSRAIRANGHCDFTVGELAKGFDDLVRWTRTGLAPAGDDVLDPAAVADPTFGCRFTETSRPTFVAEVACPTFPDVEGSVHARAIRAQLAAGVLEGFGDGTFRADAAITRGQVASIVARALGLRPSGEAPVFSDTAGTTHQDAIRALAEADLVTGYADGTFRPGELVSRAQLASIIARALRQEDPEGDCFPDVAGVHEAAVCALADLGIATGFADGTYRPSLSVSRGQAASLLDRAFG